MSVIRVTKLKDWCWNERFVYHHLIFCLVSSLIILLRTSSQEINLFLYLLNIFYLDLVIFMSSGFLIFKTLQFAKYSRFIRKII